MANSINNIIRAVVPNGKEIKGITDSAFWRFISLLSTHLSIYTTFNINGTFHNQIMLIYPKAVGPVKFTLQKSLGVISSPVVNKDTNQLDYF
jgi:hypothetical protein